MNQRDEHGRFADGMYSPELGERICDELVEGKSIKSIAAMEGMPSKRTILRWVRTIPEFEELYRFAQRERVEGFVEEIVEIADNASNDWMESNDPDNPGWRFNGEHVQRSKVRLEARKWVAAKVYPRLYGDKLDLTHANPDGSPMAVEFHIVDHRQKTED